ncbi:DUF6476 family protein [Roseobacter ponti]|uniref:Uncharacterized protein n=1 Tax=Roseobacter ponti TaxID=1891787 RepID=A0A858SUX4_9RHOB|nr:DUF6476 family protein [Roseobacter ponti]QJF50696.1 hypothetical protein G3256_05755 [Roseobacter ponti]
MENPESETDAPEPANLRFLRRLVTVLTGVMTGGVLLIIALIVIRFYDAPPPLPEEILLPEGAAATAFTQGDGWYAIVTDDNRILIYDRVTGQLEQTIAIR